MLAQKLNVASTYPFIENAKAGFGIRTSLEREVDLGKYTVWKNENSPISADILYYLLECREITHEK